MTKSSYVIEADEATFEEQVVARSREVPVLVDFWAPWCGPCQVLGPILERVAEELDGKVMVAKVDSDENPRLAQAFRVQGIPFVVLMRDGEAVDRFVGVRREAEIHDFLRKHLPSPADGLLTEAGELLIAGNLAEACSAYERALEADCHCQAARLGLARIALAEGDGEGVRKAVEGIPVAADELEAGEKLLELAKMVESVGEGESGSNGGPGADSSERARVFRAAVAAIASGEERRGLEELLGIAEADKAWQQEAPRKAMVATFQVLGVRNPLSDEFRDKLRRIYY